MSTDALPPLLILFSSLLPGLVIFFLPEQSVRLRTVLNLCGAVFKVVVVIVDGGSNPHLPSWAEAIVVK